MRTAGLEYNWSNAIKFTSTVILLYQHVMLPCPSSLATSDIKSRWRHNWKSAQVVNSHLVCDPTIRQPGFDLPRQQWSLMNRFRAEQGHCGACRRKWRLTDTELWPCGETQMMSHTVESCPLTKLNGGLFWLHSVDEDAVSWLTNMVYDTHMRRRSTSYTSTLTLRPSSMATDLRHILVSSDAIFSPDSLIPIPPLISSTDTVSVRYGSSGYTTLVCPSAE